MANSSLEIFPRKSQHDARLNAYQAEHGPQMKKNNAKLRLGHAVARSLHEDIGNMPQKADGRLTKGAPPVDKAAHERNHTSGADI